MQTSIFVDFWKRGENEKVENKEIQIECWKEKGKYNLIHWTKYYKIQFWKLIVIYHFSTLWWSFPQGTSTLAFQLTLLTSAFQSEQWNTQNVKESEFSDQHDKFSDLKFKV